MKLMHVTHTANSSVITTACRLDRDRVTGEEQFFCCICNKQVVPADDDPQHVKDHASWVAPRMGNSYR